MVGVFLTVLYILACFVLILFVLLQPGKADASGMFGGGVNSAAFGPRGTQTVLAKVTITAAIVFFLVAFLFSIPGLFEKRSLGQSVGPAESAPATVPLNTPAEPSPAAQPETQPSAAPAVPAQENSNKQTKPAESKNAKPAAGNKN